MRSRETLTIAIVMGISMSIVAAIQHGPSWGVGGIAGLLVVLAVIYAPTLIRKWFRRT